MVERFVIFNKLLNEDCVYKHKLVADYSYCALCHTVSATLRIRLPMFFFYFQIGR